MDQQTEKGQTEGVRVIGPGSRTREEIVKWNQMTALRFKTGGWERERDIRHPRPPFGVRVQQKPRPSYAAVSENVSLHKRIKSIRINAYTEIMSNG